MTTTLEKGPSLLTPKEVANRLKVSLRQVYHLVNAGGLPPPLKVGHQNRWREVDLASYLDRLAEVSRDTGKAA